MINLPGQSIDIEKFKLILASKTLDCYVLSAITACWIIEQNLNNGSPVHIVTHLADTWSHTVCEVKGIGTLDGKNNLYIPNYYYHKQPATEQQFNDAKPVFNWYDTQKKHTNAKKWCCYEPSQITKTTLLLFGDYTNFSPKMELI